MIIANENTKYQLKQITTEIIYILNTELKQRTHYENDRISISHIPIINIFRGQRIGINKGGARLHQTSQKFGVSGIKDSAKTSKDLCM